MTRTNERRPAGAASETSKGAGVDTSLADRPGTFPRRVHRCLVLRVEPLDTTIVVALVLWLPLAVCR
jgi:hypothetical protein